MGEQSQISMQTLLDAISQCKTDLLTKVDNATKELHTKLMEVNNKLDTLGEQVNEVQQRVSANEDDVEDLKKRMTTMEKENDYLKQKVERMENRNTLKRIRIANIPELSEGTNGVAYVQQLIQYLFGADNFPNNGPAIESARRAGPKQNDSPTKKTREKTTRPRQIVVEFLSFQDKAKVLRLAREKRELQLNEDCRIYINNEFSPEILKQRGEFQPVKKLLREKNIEYSLMYPAILRIKRGDEKPRLFRNPKEVEDFIKELK